jgi:hypothetical protein
MIRALTNGGRVGLTINDLPLVSALFCAHCISG